MQAPVKAGAEADEGYEELALMVDGVSIETLAEDPDRLRDAVFAVVETYDPEKIRAWTTTLQSRDGNAADVHENLWGLAGFPGAQLLETYLASLSPTYEKRVVSGKIVDYVFDDAEKDGHLAVNTKVEYFNTPASYAAKVPDRVQRYHWDIDVLKDTYEVRMRQGDPSHPDNPFPGTVTFPKSATNPALESSIWFRGLDHKLWAKGTGIVVRHVYEVLSDGSIERLPDTNAYYRRTDANCIDLMFKGYPPAIDLPEQKYYCLGRCDQPEVVNTH